MDQHGSGQSPPMQASSGGQNRAARGGPTLRLALLLLVLAAILALISIYSLINAYPDFSAMSSVTAPVSIPAPPTALPGP